jgi:BirA family biotin operon repressor/biotin-[acetyl-CoA-carboxylase] ligase
MPSSQALNLTELAHALGSVACRFDVDLLDCCDSSNAVLLARAEAGAPAGTVVVATTQTAGRGRRGRQWISAPGDSLTFSLLWRFAPGTVPTGLSLAVGLAVAQAIEHTSLRTPIRLKWPNDLLLDGKKLGGILIELLPGAPHVAVIGIGLNLHLPASLPVSLRSSSAALNPGMACERLLASLLIELLAVLEKFSLTGFSGLRQGWLDRHAFQDAPVCLAGDFGPPRNGMCRGVDDDGALLFEADGSIERILAGELSLRGGVAP